MPTLDLTPMLTVMMGVLGFFVVISTMISAPPDRVDVTPPGGDSNETQGEGSGAKSFKPLIVCLQGQDQAKVEGQTLTQAEVLGRVGNFVTTNPEASVSLIAEPTVPYQEMLDWLAEMRTTGGARVELSYAPDGIPASSFCEPVEG